MNFHSESVKDVLEELSSSNEGLSRKESLERIKKYGENKLAKKKNFNFIKVFLEQFKSFLIIILIFAAVVSFFMDSMVDSIVIFSIIMLNASLGFIQEYRAEKAIEELQKMMIPFSKVIRDNKEIKIKSEEVVPGDILVLEEGDKIMADARIISSDGLKVNEASLTGESVPTEKIFEKIKSNSVLADRINMVYCGTVVVSGSAKVVVVNTGVFTEIGKISMLVQEVKKEKNPFKDKLDIFARNIGILVLILSAIIVIALTFNGTLLIKSFLVAVSLAVSAIPEGLPAVISLGLAFATRRMAKKNVFIRKLPASETLGRVTVICTDKTGTLTEEKMEVTMIYSNNEFNLKDNKDLLKIGILCNKAKSETDDQGKKYYLGDPTEIALIKFAENNHLFKKELTNNEPKIKEFPFSSERKMMSIIRKTKKSYVAYVKGAPEKILEKSIYEKINNKVIKISEKRRIELVSCYEKMAKSGLRVLGFSYKEINNINNLKIEDAEKNLVFVGFQGMIDPPRKEVKESIKLCNQAGIKVLMITGDSKLTAEVVAKKIGLTGKSVDSVEMQKMSDKELLKNIDRISVFSRISPEDKLRIVNILKKKGEIVAMTGDGVNDSLALKRADIGISMGIRGTDVARDSSDIVLADDNFASIVEGVKEGRTIYQNIKKFIMFLLAANFYEVVFVLSVILIWKNPDFLPFLPLQILWINLVTDSLPALALSMEGMEKDVMKNKPNKEGILQGISGFIFFSGIVGLIIVFIVFVLNINDIDKARTMVVTSSIIYQMFLVYNCKTKGPVFKNLNNKYLFYAVSVSIGLHLLVLFTPLSEFFYFTPLNYIDWIQIITLSFAGFLVMEGFKVFYHKER